MSDLEYKKELNCKLKSLIDKERHSPSVIYVMLKENNLWESTEDELEEFIEKEFSRKWVSGGWIIIGTDESKLNIDANPNNSETEAPPLNITASNEATGSLLKGDTGESDFPLIKNQYSFPFYSEAVNKDSSLGSELRNRIEQLRKTIEKVNLNITGTDETSHEQKKAGETANNMSASPDINTAHTEIKDLLTSFQQQLTECSKAIEEVKSAVSNIQKEILSSDAQIDKFFDIFNGRSIQKSVYINEEILAQVKQKFGYMFQDKINYSQIINSALLFMLVYKKDKGKGKK